MASFGSFETDREIDSGPSHTIYSARKAGEARPDYLVKVFHILPGDALGEGAAELDSLLADLQRASLQRVALQEQAAAASPFIAPVIESGQDDRGVWYATHLQPRSVGKIISGRVALNRNALHHILLATASGALAFKQACGRSHGEIGPDVIHIGRSEKVEQAEVLLSDPLPGDASLTAQFETADLRAIGKILLQLVRQREITDEDDFHILPILASPEWTNLFGKDTERWLAICNRLLDPNLSPDQCTLEQLVQELEALRAKPAVPRGVLIGAGALVLVLLAAGGGALYFFKRGALAIVSDPPGAEIKLEAGGQTRSLGKTPLTAKGLDKGTYNLSAEYPGLEAQSEEVTVEGGKTREVRFEFVYGQVKLTTQPAGATVELGGQSVGQTPYTSPALPPGPQTYVLRLENHRPAMIPVVVASNRQTTEVSTNLIPVKKDERYISFESDPSGASVQVEGMGTNATITAPNSLVLSHGEYKVTARLQEWPPAQSNLVVTAGAGEQKLAFVFPSGRVLFSIEPEDAELVLNDKPLRLEGRQRKLQPRDYKLRVSKPGYYPAETGFTVLEGVMTNVNVKLKPMHGSVTFTSDPPGATIDIFDTRQPGRPFGSIANVTSVSTNLPPADYTFVARHQALKLDSLQAGPFPVPIGTNIPLPFKFTYGTLQLGSVPSGAAVLIGGQKFTTPYTHRQKPGPVAYRVELDYYQPEEGTRELAAGANVELNFPLRPKEVELGLTSVPSGAEFYLSNAPLKVVGGRAALAWGAKTIVARLPTLPGLPGLDPQTKIVEVAKDGSTREQFAFSYATLDITNSEAEAKLIYQDKPVTAFPARFFVRPDVPYDFVVEYGPDFRTNLPTIKVAAGRVFTPAIVLPELRRNYTNSLGMVFIRVTRDFYLGQFEVTQGDYQRVTGAAQEGSAQLPMTLVTWEMAETFCQQLKERDKDGLAQARLPGWTYGLPSDKEFALAAGADLQQLAEAVFSPVSLPLEINPARKSFNPAGFYDLFGNAAEWCYGPNSQRITIGGGCNRPRPRQGFPQDLYRLAVTVPQAPTIGFRCALRAAGR